MRQLLSNVLPTLIFAPVADLTLNVRALLVLTATCPRAREACPICLR